MIPNSVRFDIERSQGRQGYDWSVQLASLEPLVVYEVKVVHHGIGVSGQIVFHFEYDLMKD